MKQYLVRGSCHGIGVVDDLSYAPDSLTACREAIGATELTVWRDEEVDEWANGPRRTRSVPHTIWRTRERHTNQYDPSTDTYTLVDVKPSRDYWARWPDNGTVYLEAYGGGGSGQLEVCEVIIDQEGELRLPSGSPLPTRMESYA